MTNLSNIKLYTVGKWVAVSLIIAAIIFATVIPSSASPSPVSPTSVETPLEVKNKIASPVIEEAPRITAHDERQLQCLARNAYFEAGNQSNKGMVAVTNVVMNRVNDKRFPKTPCAVIHQRTRSVCQFSWVCEGRKRVRNQEVFARARAAAERVYLNEMHDVTHGALFYHADYVSPNWRLRRVIKIGAHIFYRG